MEVHIDAVCSISTYMFFISCRYEQCIPCRTQSTASYRLLFTKGITKRMQTLLCLSMPVTKDQLCHILMPSVSVSIAIFWFKLSVSTDFAHTSWQFLEEMFPRSVVCVHKICYSGPYDFFSSLGRYESKNTAHGRNKSFNDEYWGVLWESTLFLFQCIYKAEWCISILSYTFHW